VPSGEQPRLVSDSPFNDYADSFYMLGGTTHPLDNRAATSTAAPSRTNNPNPNSHSTPPATSSHAINGASGVIFGLGAGRIEQNVDGMGAKWFSLQQWNGTPADPNGYNPANPFFGPVWPNPPPDSPTTLRDWGCINSGCGAPSAGCRARA
jgi:hypothetical protein